MNCESDARLAGNSVLIGKLAQRNSSEYYTGRIVYSHTRISGRWTLLPLEGTVRRRGWVSNLSHIAPIWITNLARLRFYYGPCRRYCDYTHPHAYIHLYIRIYRTYQKPYRLNKKLKKISSRFQIPNNRRTRKAKIIDVTIKKNRLYFAISVKIYNYRNNVKQIPRRALHIRRQTANLLRGIKSGH